MQIGMNVQTIENCVTTSFANGRNTLLDATLSVQGMFPSVTVPSLFINNVSAPLQTVFATRR